jgi:uncharacterized protein (UPF0335 family)
MTQMSLLPNAKSAQQTKSRDGTCNGDAMKSNEGDVLEGASAKPNGAVDPALIGKLFGRFQESEEQNKDANDKKVAIFADAKAAGLDPRAVRVAFRQRLRELDTPELGRKHDVLNSLTVSYLDALRADAAPVGQNGASHSAASYQSFQTCAEPLARSRAREGATEVSDGSASDVPSSKGVHADLTASKSLIDDEPEIPDFLWRRNREIAAE